MFDFEEEEDQAIWLQNIETVIDSLVFGLLMFVVTVWALFGDDLRLILTYKRDDEVFVVLNIVCLVFFLLELGASQDIRLCQKLPSRVRRNVCAR